MNLVVAEHDSHPLPARPISVHKGLAWPVCGRVVEVSGGTSGQPLRCHLAHGHRGDCDDLGSAELEHWQANVSQPQSAPQKAVLDDVKVVAAAHARTYEAMAHWKRERGWRVEAERLDAMADALRHLVQVLEG